MVLNGQVGSTSSSSTSSSDSSVTSAHQDDLDIPDTAMTQNTSPTINLSSLVAAVQNHLNAVPLPISLKRTWNTAFQPILLSNDLIRPTDANNCRAIVPYVPCSHAVLIQLWASKVDEYEAMEANKLITSTMECDQNPV